LNRRNRWDQARGEFQRRLVPEKTRRAEKDHRRREAVALSLPSRRMHLKSLLDLPDDDEDDDETLIEGEDDDDDKAFLVKLQKLAEQAEALTTT
jgi:hypothetical protein